MRALHRAALALPLALLAACSSGDASGPTAGAEPDAQPGTTLLGSVGTPENPEAFEIALTTQDGTPVEVLAAGAYTIVVSDPARIHNFHLSGPGVDVETEVAGTGEQTFEVSVEAGEYEYVCDPHPGMKGGFSVV
jgi:plastocyanin